VEGIYLPGRRALHPLPGGPLQEKEGEQHQYTVAAAGGRFVYLLGVRRFPAGVISSDPGGALAQFGGAGHPNGKITAKKQIKLGTNPGVEWVEEWDEGGPMIYSGRAYAVGDSLFQLGVLTSKGRLAKAEVPKFFGSFKTR
jgi:hypothetical protein